MEQLTLDLIIRSLPLVSDRSTTMYRTISIEKVCSFCLELLSLPTLPHDPMNNEHSHYRVAKHLLDSIHSNVTYRTPFIIKSYLIIIKQLQFHYLTKEQLEEIFNQFVRLLQVR